MCPLELLVDLINGGLLGPVGSNRINACVLRLLFYHAMLLLQLFLETSELRDNFHVIELLGGLRAYDLIESCGGLSFD